MSFPFVALVQIVPPLQTLQGEVDIAVENKANVDNVRDKLTVEWIKYKRNY